MKRLLKNFNHISKSFQIQKCSFINLNISIKNRPISSLRFYSAEQKMSQEKQVEQKKGKKDSKLEEKFVYVNETKKGEKKDVSKIPMPKEYHPTVSFLKLKKVCRSSMV